MNSISGKIISLLCLVLVALSAWNCRPPAAEFILHGKTMGTSYSITYFDTEKRDFQTAVDSILIHINKSISTYDSASEISRFNHSKRAFVFSLPYFFPPLKKSQEVFRNSSGAYDPTVMPFVNAWGFGPERISYPDTNRIVEARQYVGFEKIHFNEDSIWKDDPRVQIDFSAIGQGYGADVIADFFRSKSIKNFFIELGGEGVTSGKNIKEDREWQIGIADPCFDCLESKIIATVKTVDKGYTTSGNYYNYREVNGIRYSHTIDPKTGFPVQNELLSATVFADNCATADAWATAIMSMGYTKAIETLNSHPELTVILVYESAEGDQIYISDALAADVSVSDAL